MIPTDSHARLLSPSLCVHAGGGGGAGGLNADSSNDDYLKAAKDVQDKTADAYKGALDLVNATKDVRHIEGVALSL